MHSAKHLLLIFLLSLSAVSAPVFLSAQEGSSRDDSAQAVDERLAAREAEFERILDESLSAAEAGEWESALELLDKAETYYPEDPRIADYRISFTELAALESAQNSWAGGTPAEVTVENPTTADDGDEVSGDTEEPKFTIDRGDMDPRESPILTRDNFRAELSLRLFSIDPVDSYARNGWTSVDEFFYTCLGADVAYWMPFMRKSLGFNFRSSGYAYRPGNPSLIFNTLDIGLNIRGFLAETKTSRLEIGLDFGGSFQSTIDVAVSTDRSWSLYLGLWASDPLLYHLFNADSLENLLFGGGIRIYSSFSDEIFEMVNYRLDASWLFLGGHVGVRLEWWDFVISDTRTNMTSLSLIGGYRF